MVRIIFGLFLSLVSSCSLSSPSFPEEYLLETRQITLQDLDIMINTGFDFTSQAPDGKTYLDHLLSHPQPMTQELLDILIQKNLINPRTTYADGRNLLNYVVSNPGDISLKMAQSLMQGKYRNFFLQSPYSPLLDAIKNTGKIAWTLMDYLIKEGFSINAQDAKTGVTPALEFLKTYAEESAELEDYIFEHIDVHIRDFSKKNLWHYLFANRSQNLLPFMEMALKLKDSKKLLITPGTKGVYPLFVLVTNPERDVYSIYQSLQKNYKEQWKKQSWVDELFLYTLSNTGGVLGMLFQDIITKHPNVNALNSEGQNSLLVAIQNPGEGLLTILEYLIKHRVNIYQLDKKGRSVLYYAVLNRGIHAADRLSFLERQGVSLTVADDTGRNLINYAVLNEGAGATKILNLLLEKGLPVLTPDKEGVIPLERLFQNQSKEGLSMLRALIYASYQGKAAEPYSQNIIFSAAKSTSFYAYKMMLTIIQQGFSIYSQNIARQNALFFTVQNTGPDALRMTRLLLMKGLPADVVDRDGNTLLHYAIKNPVHRFSMVNLLVKWKTDPYRHNIFGYSAVSTINQMDTRTKWRFKQIFAQNHLKL